MLVFYVTLEWSVPGLFWGMTLSQFFYGIAVYATWHWRGIPRLFKPKRRDAHQSNDPEWLKPYVPTYSGTGDTHFDEPVGIGLAFFIMFFLMGYLMAFGYWFGMYPLVEDGHLGDSFSAALDIYWPIIVTTFVLRFRDLPWGEAYTNRNSFFPYFPVELMVNIGRNLYLIFLGAIIYDQEWNIYGPIVFLIALIYFLEPPKLMKGT